MFLFVIIMYEHNTHQTLISFIIPGKEIMESMAQLQSCRKLDSANSGQTGIEH